MVEITAEMAILIQLVMLFLIKVLDNIILTSKTILIQKNRSVLAAMTVVVSQIIFYELIDAVSDNGDLAMYVVSIASGVGTYIALKISDKLSKERTYINVIMSDNKNEMILLREFLKENKITNLATDAYTKDWEKTISITVYADTKEESRLIDKYLESRDNKFKRIVEKA